MCTWEILPLWWILGIRVNFYGYEYTMYPSGGKCGRDLCEGYMGSPVPVGLVVVHNRWG